VAKSLFTHRSPCVGLTKRRALAKIGFIDGNMTSGNLWPEVFTFNKRTIAEKV
jgi:hypothetical protein